MRLTIWVPMQDEKLGQHLSGQTNFFQYITDVPAMLTVLFIKGAKFYKENAEILEIS